MSTPSFPLHALELTDGRRPVGRCWHRLGLGLSAAALLFASATAFADTARGGHRFAGPSFSTRALDAYELKDINNEGEVVGLPLDPGTQSAALWRQGRHGTVAIDLGAPGGTRSTSQALNGRGEIVGAVDRPGSTRWHALVWTRAGAFDLPSLGGDGSYPMDINDHGLVVGASSTGSSDSWPTLWRHARPEALPTLGGTVGVAQHVNRWGVIVGYARDHTDQRDIPVRWVRTAVQALPTLGGLWGSAFSINDRGLIVGVSALASGESHATLWRKDQAEDLGALPSYQESIASDVNESGWIVGESRRAYPSQDLPHATLWIDDDLVDLNEHLDAAWRDQGWVLIRARALNDSGRIVCDGFDPQTGQNRGFVLVPGPRHDGPDRDRRP